MSYALYDKLGVVLFALKISNNNNNNNSESKLLLNPAEFIIPPKSELRVEAFVIAKNKADADLTFVGNYYTYNNYKK